MKVSGLSGPTDGDPDKNEEGRTEEHEGSARIRADAETIRDYFDSEYYLEHNADVRESEVDPLLHFCEYGWRELRDPRPDFSTRYYLNANSEVRDSGINPLVHFVTIGKQQGLQGKLPDIRTLPEAAKQAHISREISEAAPHFDAEFYLDRYGDVAESGMNPLEHYMYYGWHEGRDPCAQFSTSFYLSENPDIKASGVNPFWHYIAAGGEEGRPAHPAGLDATNTDNCPIVDADIEAIRPYFDTEFYLYRNPDLARADIDPIKHYCTYGWREGRDPCSFFSTHFYLDSNPDIKRLNINPFWHYVTAGREEGRRTQHPGGYRFEMLRNSIPLEDEVRKWRFSRLPKRCSTRRT